MKGTADCHFQISMKTLILILLFPCLAIAQPGIDENWFRVIAENESVVDGDTIHVMTPSLTKLMLDHWFIIGEVNAGTHGLSNSTVVTINHNENLTDYHPFVIPVHGSGHFFATIQDVSSNSFDVEVKCQSCTLGWGTDLTLVYLLMRTE